MNSAPRCICSDAYANFANVNAESLPTTTAPTSSSGSNHSSISSQSLPVHRTLSYTPASTSIPASSISSITPLSPITYTFFCRASPTRSPCSPRGSASSPSSISSNLRCFRYIAAAYADVYISYFDTSTPSDANFAA